MHQNADSHPDTPLVPPPTDEVEASAKRVAWELNPADVRRVARLPFVKAHEQGRAQSQKRQIAFYDTAELELEQLGASLAIWRDGQRFEQALRGPASLDSGLAPQRRWHGPLPTRLPDLEAFGDDGPEWLAEFAGTALVPVFTVTETRRKRLLTLANGAELELAVVQGQVSCDDRQAEFCELRLTLLDGPAASLLDAADGLLDDLEAHPVKGSLADRGYTLRARAPIGWHKQVPLELPADATAEVALSAIMRDALAHLRANEACALTRTHIEGVHQMRVALRRLRSILRLFRPLLPGDSVREMNGEMRWLIQELGAARDLDVFLDEILGPVLAACPDESALTVLQTHCLAAQDHAYDRVEQALSSNRYVRLQLALEQWIEQRGWRDQQLSESSARLFQPATRVAADVLDKHAKRVRKGGRHFEKQSIDELHALRIKVKGLRYACDFFVSLYDRDQATAYVKRLSRLQTALGQTNDLAVARELMARLTEQAPESDQPALHHAAGFVLGYHWHGLEQKLAKRAKRWKDHHASTPFWRD